MPGGGGIGDGEIVDEVAGIVAVRGVGDHFIVVFNGDIAGRCKAVAGDGGGISDLWHRGLDLNRGGDFETHRGVLVVKLFGGGFYNMCAGPQRGYGQVNTEAAQVVGRGRNAAGNAVDVHGHIIVG